MPTILGISCWYHDAAACLLRDGQLVAAAQEERFTRIKHDDAFPKNAITYCLNEAGVDSVDAVAFYDKPLLKFHRILETSLAVAPKGFGNFVRAIPSWMREKLWAEPVLLGELSKLGLKGSPKVFFPEHHFSHAASAFYPSPFSEAAVITLDGVGEWASSTIGVGEGSDLRLLVSQDFPHSLGLLYSAFTYFCGFKVNSGEYKLMGLAPYGEPTFTQTILDNLLDLNDDGSFRLNLEYFGFMDDLVMTSQQFATLFGGPARSPDDRITKREMDLARSIQDVTEQVVLRTARHAKQLTGKKNLCLAGGVALNCVANGKLLRSNIFGDLWIQPGAGDCGGAVGAAYAAYHQALGGTRVGDEKNDAMQGAYLGPEFGADDIEQWLKTNGYAYQAFKDDSDWAQTVAAELANGKVVGLFQGRMEFGPRSLGNRSIIGDARSAAMQSTMNIKIKQRESFRPFAPSVREEDTAEFFELDGPSPYMLLVADVRSERRTKETDPLARTDDLLSWVNRPRSDVPAITHVDHSARIQTVSKDTNPRYHQLLSAFKELTGVGLLVNTSFNVRGEPIVCTPSDAYRCFMGTEMDVLSLGPFLLRAEEQPGFSERAQFQRTFAAD